MVNLNNLRATVRAYSKVKGSSLDNYATKEELGNVESSFKEELDSVESSLSNSLDTLRDYSESTYIKDVIDDGKTYARKDKNWVEIISNVILIYSGFDSHEIIDVDDADYVSALEITDLSNYDEVPIDSRTFTFEQELEEDGKCFWFCSSMPILGMTSSGLPAAYTKVGEEKVNGVVFFCYRTDPLIANNWNFRINF